MISGKLKLFSLLFLALAAGLLWRGLEPSQETKDFNSEPTSPLEQPPDNKAEKLPLPVFLEKYEHANRIKLHRETKMPNNIYVSSHLLTLPPEEALLKALTNFSVLLGYAASTEQRTSRLKEAWIYSEQHDLTSAIVKNSMTPPPQNDMDSFKAEEAVDIIARGGKDVDQVIDQALQDSDETVRYRALVAASEAGSDILSSTLIKILQTDPSEIVRGAALTALQKNPEIDEKTFESLLNWAAMDPSPYVQNMASDILSASQTDATSP